MWLVIVVVLAIVALAWWYVPRRARYGRVFGDQHFTEVARGVARIKTAAMERPDVALVHAPTDPRLLVTSKGLVLLYTLTRTGDRFEHHYSLSLGGGYTAHAPGATFVLFVAKLLGVPFQTLALSVAPSTAHHAEFHLSAAEQEGFTNRPVPEPTPDEIMAFRREFFDVRERLQWRLEKS